MGILKPQSSSPLSPFHAKDLETEAAAHLAEARKKADAMIRAAKDEALRIVQSADAARQAGAERGVAQGRVEGIEKGRAEGRLAALAEAQKSLAPGATLVRLLLEQLGPALDDAVRGAAEDAQARVIRLALEIAKSIVKREVAIDDGVLRANVASAIALAARRDGLEIRVHPKDLVLMDQFVPELSARFEGLDVARVTPDESVGRGGARVVWDEGSVGAGIAEQLAQIEKLLLGDGA